MNQSERELVAYLTGLKGRKIGFMELHTDVPDSCAEIFLDARYRLFASECIFDDCTDAQAKLFLESFLANGLSVGWEVSLQLSKLLATRGQLVRQTIEPLLMTLDWGTYNIHLLYLSYLALIKEEGPALAGRMLDEVPEDGRDALFLACHRLQSEKLDSKLIEKFMEWGTGNWGPADTGELYALEQFIAKWLGLYPFRDLEGVIRLYFRHRDENRRHRKAGRL